MRPTIAAPLELAAIHHASPEYPVPSPAPERRSIALATTVRGNDPPTTTTSIQVYGVVPESGETRPASRSYSKVRKSPCARSNETAATRRAGPPMLAVAAGARPTSSASAQAMKAKIRCLADAAIMSAIVRPCAGHGISAPANCAIVGVVNCVTTPSTSAPTTNCCCDAAPFSSVGSSRSAIGILMLRTGPPFNEGGARRRFTDRAARSRGPS